MRPFQATPEYHLVNGLAFGVDWSRDHYREVAAEYGRDYADGMVADALALHEARKPKIEPCEGCYCERKGK